MKTEVYSWRVSAQRKSELEVEAQREGASLAELLEEITQEWLETRRGGRTEEASEQARLRAKAVSTFGTISGGNSERSEQARSILQRRLKEQHASRRTR